MAPAAVAVAAAGAAAAADVGSSAAVPFQGASPGERIALATHPRSRRTPCALRPIAAEHAPENHLARSTMNHTRSIVLLSALLLGTLVAGGCSTPEASYPTPQAAVDALVASLEAPDRAGIEKVFGTDGAAILHSGDDVQDNITITEFLRQYQERHALVAADDDEMTLVVGPTDWPMPIPLRHEGSGWRFDVAAGEDEMLSRRIGRNELTTIQVMLAIVDAQNDYAASGAGGPGAYAQRFLSTPGTRDGLYWPTAEGEPQSPLGELVADAASEGYGTTASAGARRPYHGYFYRILTSQGPDAPGGAMDYLQNGAMTGGFAAIAWPVQYGSSGIMTFLVSKQGVVYQADLGSGTDHTAATMPSFNPDARWALASQ